MMFDELNYRKGRHCLQATAQPGGTGPGGRRHHPAWATHWEAGSLFLSSNASVVAKSMLKIKAWLYLLLFPILATVCSRHICTAPVLEPYALATNYIIFDLSPDWHRSGKLICLVSQ